MPLNKLCKKIEEEARMEVEAILSAAKKEADSIKSSYENKKSKYENKIKMKAAQLSEEKRRNIVTNARIIGRNNELKLKQDILDEVFQRCSKEIEGLDSKKYAGFLKRLIIDSKMKKLDITPGKKDKAIFNSDFIKEMKKNNCSITISDNVAKFDKGFIANSGEMEMDFSLSSVLANKKSELTVAINSILFSNS